MSTPTDKSPRDVVWVPENFVFESAEECLGKFPDEGPACCFDTPSAYLAVKQELEAARELFTQAHALLKSRDEQIADYRQALETLKAKWDLAPDAKTTVSYGIVNKALEKWSGK